MISVFKKAKSEGSMKGLPQKKRKILEEDKLDEDEDLPLPRSNSDVGAIFSESITKRIEKDRKAAIAVLLTRPQKPHFPFNDEDVEQKTVPVVENKAKRKFETVDDLSDYDERSDDEAAREDQMSYLDKMQFIMKRGPRKFVEHRKLRLLSNTFDQKNKSRNKNEKHDRFEVSHPRQRKVFAAQLSSTVNHEEAQFNKNNTSYVQMGPQTHSIFGGEGYKIQAAGSINTDGRPSGISEPAAEYAHFFPTLLMMGKDANAAALYKKATGNDLREGIILTDADAAQILYYYFNTDTKVVQQDLERSQLTEHLAKFTAITGVSEQARGFGSNKNAPYDASVLIKACLKRVITGLGDKKFTLKDMFYKGKDGKDAIFLGALTDGGAQRLRDPLAADNKAALERQMSIFPSTENELRSFLTSLRTGGKMEAIVQTDEQRKAAQEAFKAQQLEAVQELINGIKHIPKPADANGLLAFNDGARSAIGKYRAKINKFKKSALDDPAIQKAIMRALTALKKWETAGINHVRQEEQEQQAALQEAKEQADVKAQKEKKRKGRETKETKEKKRKRSSSSSKRQKTDRR